MNLSPELIILIMNLSFLGIIVLAFLAGLMRGLYKTTLYLVFSLVFFVVGILLIGPISEWLLGVNLSFLNNFLPENFKLAAGKLNELSKEELEKNYPNATGEDLMAFKRQLEELKKEFDDKGITIIPRDVTVNGIIETMDGNGKSHKINVVGTLDLLGYDKDGNWHIYDMKTHHSKIKNATKQKYARSEERRVGK